MFEIGALLNDFNALTDYQGDRMVVALREKIEALVEVTYETAWEDGSYNMFSKSQLFI
jgi:hypothetical protein